MLAERATRPGLAWGHWELPCKLPRSPVSRRRVVHGFAQPRCPIRAQVGGGTPWEGCNFLAPRPRGK
jgi:hypothetical protein